MGSINYKKSTLLSLAVIYLFSVNIEASQICDIVFDAEANEIRNKAHVTGGCYYLQGETELTDCYAPADVAFLMSFTSEYIETQACTSPLPLPCALQVTNNQYFLMRGDKIFSPPFEHASSVINLSEVFFDTELCRNKVPLPQAMQEGNTVEAPRFYIPTWQDVRGLFGRQNNPT